MTKEEELMATFQNEVLNMVLKRKTFWGYNSSGLKEEIIERVERYAKLIKII